MTHYHQLTPEATTMQSQPVAIILTAAWAVLNAGLLMANALGWTHLDGTQLAAIGTFVTTVTGVAGAVIHRSVYSPATVLQMTTERHPAAGGSADG